MTALQESGLRMYANKNVPESLNYPHDAVGSDYDSLNPFQQRVKYWGTVAQLMNLDYAINAFYTALQRVPGWAVMRPGLRPAGSGECFPRCVREMGTSRRRIN